MSVSTSITGSIGVVVIADTRSAPKIIVVREDIYKGLVLLGTTYRNLTFTSTFYTPIGPVVQLRVVFGTAASGTSISPINHAAAGVTVGTDFARNSGAFSNSRVTENNGVFLNNHGTVINM
jgi:hypothetical protein